MTHTSEESERRVNACVNACAGIPIEVLKAHQSGGLPWRVSDQIEKLSDLANAEKQRDELLAALKEIVLISSDERIYRIASNAISKFEAKHD